MSYRIDLLSGARRDWRALAPAVQQRIAPSIDALADNPKPAASKPLAGVLRGKRSLRVGDWRIVYRVDEGEALVEITQIAHRHNVYQRAERKVGD